MAGAGAVIFVAVEQYGDDMTAIAPIGGEGAAGAGRVMDIACRGQDHSYMVVLCAGYQSLDSVAFAVEFYMCNLVVFEVASSLHICRAVGASFTYGFQSDVKHDDCLVFCKDIQLGIVPHGWQRINSRDSTFASVCEVDKREKTRK